MFRRVLLVSVLMIAAGCVEDYDVAEVAPAEHLDEEHDHHYEDEHHDEDVDPDHSAPSGHSHGAGVRNHGTQWFFNQPWAARFIWGKLVRDAVIFLALGGILFYLTGRKRR